MSEFVTCPLCGDPERPEDIVGGVCLACADGIAFAQNARRGAVVLPHPEDDWIASHPLEDDPLNGSDGYPHPIELRRIAAWPMTAWSDLRSLMAYVKERWSYPEMWSELDIDEWGSTYREYAISTGGWSGNESLIGALEENAMFRLFAPWSWRRGGHYVYRIQYEKEERDAQSTT